MEITNQLRATFVNDNSSIQSVEVQYSNGTSISGFIQRANFEELNVTLCQHEVDKGENPLHIINFEEAEEVKLLYEDGSERVFN